MIDKFSSPFIQELHLRPAFRELFMTGYNLDKPVALLESIVHWQAQMQYIQRTDTSLGRYQTFLFGGYFYNFTTPALSPLEIQTAISEATQYNAAQVLVPTIRDTDDCSGLVDAGFQKIPCFIDVAFDLENGVDADLENRVGNKRMREIRRIHRKANKEYELKIYEGKDQLTDEVLQLASELHNYNALKYKHPVNFYNLTVLKELRNTALARNTLIAFWCNRITGKPAQVNVCFVSAEHGEIYYLVQGINQAEVSEGQNLYVASIYAMYLLASERKIGRVYLGRGSHEAKAKLGANRFYLLNHWIKSDDTLMKNEIDTIARLSMTALSLENTTLKILKN